MTFNVIRLRFAATALCIGLAATALLGQQPGGRATPPPSEIPTFRSGVEAIQVDTYVTDASGRPVRGLTKDDFEVFENRQARDIVTFAPVDIPTGRVTRHVLDVEPDVLSNDEPPGRVYLFMLSSMDADMALRTRQLLHRFMDEYFGDTDLAAVVVDRGLATDGQDFTHNQRLIRAAIDKWSGSGAHDARDLQQRMEFMARMPGNRKFVLWFTDNIGFDAYEVVDYHGGVPSLGGEYVHAAMAAATRGNIRIYPISPSGLTTTMGAAELERRMDFRAVGDVTGGFAQVGSNDFDSAFARLVLETSTYYVLGIESSGVRRQGRYVPLEVRVKRPGLQVKARPGYVEQLDAVRRQAKAEPARTPGGTALANAVSVPGVPMRVVATPYKGAGRNAAVVLTVDVAPSGIAFAEVDGRPSADLQFHHLATDARKGIYPEWRYTTPIELLSGDRERVQDTGLRIVSQLDLPEGRYQIRVASASGDQAGSVVYDLEVPDFGDDPITLSGVSLTSAAAARVLTMQAGGTKTARKTKCAPPRCAADVDTGSTLARWPTDGGSTAVALLHAGLPAPPTTTRAFGADQTLSLYTEVYDNTRADKAPPYQIVLTATLRDVNGMVMREVSESRASRAARSRSGGHGFTVRLPLEKMAPGDYVLQVEARSDRDPKHVATRRMPIQVTTASPSSGT